MRHERRLPLIVGRDLVQGDLDELLADSADAQLATDGPPGEPAGACAFLCPVACEPSIINDADLDEPVEDLGNDPGIELTLAHQESVSSPHE